MSTTKSKNGKFISTPQQIFDKHANKKDGCWEWMGYKNASGYGCTKVGGRGSKGLLAHRLSWVLHFSEIPEGLHVLHKCDNPSCVNPSHLFVGTNLENIHDRMKKNRSSHWIATAPREKHPRTKIVLEDLKKMIAMREIGIKVKDISKAFNIHKDHASKLMTFYKKGALF